MKTASRLVFIGLILSLAITTVPVSRVHGNPAIIRVPLDYATIQEAVDHALPGDTVLVSAATWQGNVTITKSLNLTGVNRDTTIIDGGGTSPGINITATSNVWVSGFTIRNTGPFYDGILVASSRGVTIAGNNVQASVDVNGVYILNSNTVTVKDNMFTGNLYGTRIQASFSSLVQKNNFTGNTIGVGIFNSTGDNIEDNILRSRDNGLMIWAGSTNILVERNLIANSTAFGITLRESRNHVVRENMIEFNRNPGYPPQPPATGIGIQNSTETTFYHNNIRNNDVQMFAVYPALGDLAQNTWNATLNSVTQGNFWSDYTGKDDGSNGRMAGDGIGDTQIPHPCPSGGQPCSASGGPGVDFVPLMSPWQPSTLSATASANRLTGYPPLLVSFTGTATGGTPPYVFSWDFGDGTGSTVQNPTHSYVGRGSYVATFTVTDNSGAARSDSVPITVLRPSGSLVVRVVDANQQPIQGANVTSLSQPSGQVRLMQIANNLGLTGFGGIIPGIYQMQASSAGYETGQKIVTVGTNETVNTTITLARPGQLDYVSLFGGIGAGAAGLVVLGLYWRARRRRTLAGLKKKPDVRVNKRK